MILAFYAENKILSIKKLYQQNKAHFYSKNKKYPSMYLGKDY